MNDLSETERQILQEASNDLEFVLRTMLEQPVTGAQMEADLLSIKVWLQLERAQRYWRSPKFAKRWAELQQHPDMTVEQAARFLHVPVAVLRWRLAHDMVLEQYGLK
jgi:hypothetical protein